MLLRPALTWISLALLTASGLGSCVAPDKLDYRVAKATCDLAVECGGYPDVRTCMDVSYVKEPSTYLDAALDAGRVDYDSAQAYRCVRAIKKLKCHRGEDQSEVEVDCQGIMSGNVEPEQPCMLGAECAGELSVCGFDPTCTDACCPGACRFIPGPFAAGEPCDMGQRCESGTFCKFDLQGGEPAAVCTERARRGEPCELSDYGLSDSCVEGTFCNDDQVCERPRKGGEACSDDRQCAPKSHCDDEVCVSLAKKGDPCENTRDCLRGDTICHENECVELLDIGESCGPLTRPCADYAVCFEETCTERGKVGDSCNFQGGGGIPCYSGLFCDEGACAKPEAAAMDVCPIPE